MIDLLPDLAVAADDHEVLRRAQHNTGRANLERRRILIALELDLTAHRVIRAVLTIDRVEMAVHARKYVQRAAIRRVQHRG